MGAEGRPTVHKHQNHMCLYTQRALNFQGTSNKHSWALRTHAVYLVHSFFPYRLPRFGVAP